MTYLDLHNGALALLAIAVYRLTAWAMHKLWPD
jgi:hypothetical protein